MNNLNGLYIVTEWDFDKDLVEMVIPEQYQQKVSVLSAGGYSAALSMARSILSARHQARTILVVDADATDERDVAEREDFIRTYMHRISGDDRFAILLQKPEIEAVFFEDKNSLEQLTGKDFSDLEFELAKDNPKRNLLNFLSLAPKHKEEVLDRAKQDVSVRTKLKESRLAKVLSHAIGRFLA